MKHLVRLTFCLFLSVPMLSLPGAEAADAKTYRGWIADMKESERGPFKRIRWFCKDGTVLPPRASGCGSHGGGHQHGEWSEQTKTLREDGYYVANLLAGLNADAFAKGAGAPDQLAQMMIERYLVSADDGWIFRRALFYRGAIQEEDERVGARRLLRRLAVDGDWVKRRYALTRSAVRMLPHGTDNPSVQKVRQMSASLSDRDAGFLPLRAKIHGAPAAEDAVRVRDYAAGLPESARAPYLELAGEIDRVYQAAPFQQELRGLAGQYTAAPWLQDLLNGAASELDRDASAAQRFTVTATLLAELRRALPRIGSAAMRLEVLDLGLRAEAEHFRAAAELRESLDSTTRRQRLGVLRAAGEAAFGAGLLNARLFDELNASLDRLDAEAVPLDIYRRELNYLGRVPGWGTQALRMPFYESMEKLAEIEPLAMLFIQDQLRGSPLLFFSQVLDGLSRDANRLAGVKHRLFGEAVGTGFTALNPGLAAGVLHVEPDLSAPANFRRDGIYLLPETVSDLPPVAGILTQGEGNPLSHVQMLARNLGIPNVTLGGTLVPRLQPFDGRRVVLAVSPSGLVELDTWSDAWEDTLQAYAEGGGVEIRPDLEKLDLSVRRIILLDELRASDSGRTVGPKAAKLGELRAHYPDQVARGVAIPFGLFRQEALEQPHPGGGTVFDWMVKTYHELGTLPVDDARRAERSEAFRAELHGIIAETKPSAAFVDGLRSALREAFGSDDPPGLFVRSDTNVEDLAGFTGAGLNLTLPNVIGTDRLLDGIAKVWASPFTARAFAWRQSHMTAPEHVYTSILLLESVASDSSGVLVTQDIDTGDRGVLSVAVNEGIGGAVDGQAAESLRIPMDGSPVRVLATATAPWRRVPDPSGGLEFLPASGSDTVLSGGEIEQLIDFARGLPATFPSITDDEGNPAPADVEFGFVGGKLQLFQLRPFLDSKSARASGYLQQMESRAADDSSRRVDLDGVPQS